MMPKETAYREQLSAVCWSIISQDEAEGPWANDGCDGCDGSRRVTPATVTANEEAETMNQVQQKAAARAFVERWQAEPGNEEEQSRSFWIQLLEEVLGIPNATHVLQFERKVRGRKIDVFYEDMGILIEQKGRGISLDEATVRSKKAGAETPYQQALWYANNLPFSVRPRWVLTCNFDEVRIYDQEKESPEEYVQIMLEDLPEHLYQLAFFADKGNSRIERERQLSVEAGEIVGNLYAQLSAQYQNIDTDRHEQYSLNVLIVRLVFLLYAEDAGLLQRRDAFLDYLRKYEAHDLRAALISLFKVLDTPDGTHGTENLRDPYASPDLLAFPYVNGGLFHDEGIVIPQFTEQARHDLLLNASQTFNWSGISPTIFGAAFESTLNPATRRAGGMHYTSIENIHKVIDPLFLDGLRAELEGIEGEKVERTRTLRLSGFQRKLASLKILDPACGSGNFLTESYLSLRRLENRVIEDLQGDQMGLGFADAGSNPIQVGIDQFYGIEINDFAVSVAMTALWIAEAQMKQVTEEILLQPLDFLPLKHNANIREGNALRMDWNDVLPAEQCSYICGNPPFVGSSLRTKEQTSDMEANAFAGQKKWGKVDYCGAWHHIAANYMSINRSIKSAFVSTNSICQGEQVEPMWRSLFEGGIRIAFAWRTFIWDSEASDKAHVHCVIVGFSFENSGSCLLFEEEGIEVNVPHINGYIYPSPNVFIRSRGRAVDDHHLLMTQGSKPVDGGELILEEDEARNYSSSHPAVAPYLRKYIGAREFMNGTVRYVIWLRDIAENAVGIDTELDSRLSRIRASREASPTKEFNKYADKPWLFVQDRQPEANYLVLPRTTSGRREYVPLGFFTPEIIASDKLIVMPGASLFDFGLLSSRFHASWMRVVSGRLKSDYEYSSGVYNNMAYPQCSSEVRAEVKRRAQGVLDARDKHPGATLADLYDPDKMPADLRQAHAALDAAVEAAYGVDFDGDEEKIVAHLFKLYAELTKGA